MQTAGKQRALLMPAGPFETWHCKAWLLPPQASWKNPPYQVEAKPLKAQNIHHLHSGETRTHTKTFPLIQIVKDKQDGATGTFLCPALAALWWKVKGVSSPPEIRGLSRAWQALRRTTGTLATTNTKHTLLTKPFWPLPLTTMREDKILYTPLKMPAFGVSRYNAHTLTVLYSGVRFKMALYICIDVSLRRSSICQVETELWKALLSHKVSWGGAALPEDLFRRISDRKLYEMEARKHNPPPD